MLSYRVLNSKSNQFILKYQALKVLISYNEHLMNYNFCAQNSLNQLGKTVKKNIKKAKDCDQNRKECLAGPRIQKFFIWGTSRKNGIKSP